jgi:transposase-like protein
MVLETFEQTGTRTGVITRIARQLGIGTESLRSWVRQAEVDGGLRPGTNTQDKEGIAALEREVRELRRTNEILGDGLGFLRGRARRPASEMTRSIDTHRDRFGVEPICRALQIAPSSYHAAKRRQPSARAISDAELAPRSCGPGRPTTGSMGPASSGSSCAARASWSAGTGSPG